MPVTHSMAQQFAQDWIAAWNAHDLDRVLAHYTDDFEMTSPLIVAIAGEPSGTLQGKAAIAQYWATALAKMPDLQFELVDVLVSVNTVVIYYRSVLGKMAAEWFWFNEAGQVTRAIGHYNS